MSHPFKVQTWLHTLIRKPFWLLIILLLLGHKYVSAPTEPQKLGESHVRDRHVLDVSSSLDAAYRHTVSAGARVAAKDNVATLVDREAVVLSRDVSTA